MIENIIHQKKVALNADNWIEITSYLYEQNCFYLYQLTEIYNHLEFVNYGRIHLYEDGKFKNLNKGTFFIEINIYETKKNFGIFYHSNFRGSLPTEVVSGNNFLRKIKLSKCFDDVMDENDDLH